MHFTPRKLNWWEDSYHYTQKSSRSTY